MNEIRATGSHLSWAATSQLKSTQVSIAFISLFLDYKYLIISNTGREIHNINIDLTKNCPSHGIYEKQLNKRGNTYDTYLQDRVICDC